MLEFNRRWYENFWTHLNQELNAKASLEEALLALEEQQLDAGFIKDDLRSVTQFRLHHPTDKARIFNIQYNPRRADRYMGAGRKIPPRGCRSVNDNCFLCKENIRWQQQGIEVGYDIDTLRSRYIAWMNPFPLKPVHTTIAATEHSPQHWILDEDEASIERFQTILTDLVELAQRLPGFIGFYNGVGAGASIPNHFHFHFLRRLEGSGPFALERAAATTSKAHQAQSEGLIVKNYPITAFYFQGSPQAIISASATWIRKLLRARRYRAALTINVIATIDPPDSDLLNVYIIPRNRYYTHAPGMVGMIGGLEVFGELVFSTDIEKQLLDTGQVDFFFAERILAAVEPLSIINAALA